MYIRKVTKSHPGLDKHYTYYRLSETYRGVDGKVRQRALLSLGTLAGVAPEKHKLLADKIEQLYRGELTLFSEVIDYEIDKLAEAFCAELVKKVPPVAKEPPVAQKVAADVVPEWVRMDLHSLHTEDVRELGAGWMSLQVLRASGIVPLLEKAGLKHRALSFCLLAWLSRMVHPASERATATWLSERSALPELLDIRPSQVNRFKLYQAAEWLYNHKALIETQLSTYTQNLFSLKPTIWLYDLTNTYFEGKMEGSIKAVHGHSKEKRSDAPLVSLALVTDEQGFPKYSHFYEGNVREAATLSDVLNTLLPSKPVASERPLVVMDAGIATSATLELLREKGCDYLCVSRRRMRQFKPDPTQSFTLEARTGDTITLQSFTDPAWPRDQFLYIKSPGRTTKERAIADKLTPRFIAELEKARAALARKGGTKSIAQVHRRIGRICQKYPRISAHFLIECSEDKAQDLVTDITWTPKPSAHSQPEGNDQLGTYFLQTSRIGLSEQEMWNIYHSLSETENAFRTLKTDLSIRPVFHQKDQNIFAHLFLGVLAYYLVAIVRRQLANKGIHLRWKPLLDLMDGQKILSTSFRDDNQNHHVIRSCSRPTASVAAIYHALNLKPVPFYQKKSVVPK